ncbi:hypothetical protein AB836_01005 [Rickettsiales bacterium (ex Bugula neritina AB1)]|nr:hypothetical protein AB836_01005 [Rickettsiales bacterium (ex Bugula neritina AB1)]
MLLFLVIMCLCGCGFFILLSCVSSIIFGNYVHYLLFLYHCSILGINNFYLKKYSYNMHILIAMFLNILVFLTKFYKNSLPEFISRSFPILWTIISVSNTIVFVTRIFLSYLNKANNNCCNNNCCNNQ